jgi:hypothetical protein
MIMKVDWRIYNNVLSGGILGTNTFVDIARQNGIFEAILGTGGYGDDGFFHREVLARKKDNSLLELMNWAEEELRFRSSSSATK